MSTRKLLLADDSITIQKVVNLTFADEGIEVFSVGNGDSAIEKLIEIAPDLVMADVNMPGLNGYQVCERIKQDDNFRQTPVILLVGSFEHFDEEEARRVGADDFLTKPFQSIRQLVNKVTVLLEKNDQNAAQLYEATANNSFADTLDMEKSDIAEFTNSEELGDAGMDDEMIQTGDVRSFALDESAKFETKEVNETFEDSKTQPLSVYDLKEFSFIASKDENDAEITNRSQTAENAFADDSAVAKGNYSSYAIFNNDDDLLEIPFDEEDEEELSDQSSSADEEIKEEKDFADESAVSEEFNEPTADYQSENEYQSAGEYQGENEIVVGSLTEPLTEPEKSEQTSLETSETLPSSNFSTEFPPELIDAVAQRVIERLSDQTVREIAWEVVPRHADLIIQKMVGEILVENKLKE